MAKKKKQKSVVGLVIVAALIGAAIGAAVFNSSAGEPAPMPPVVDKGDAYDDSVGRLNRPRSGGAVTHILVSWQGAGINTIKDPSRTKEQARSLIEDIWRRYRDNRTSDFWRELQAEYNEDDADGDPHNEYELPGRVVEPFRKVAETTQNGYARIAETQFGFHLIRRER